MKKVKLYEEFVETKLTEGFLQVVKDFVTGVKTDDDKLAKNLLNDSSKLEDIRNGFGHFNISVNFRYNGYLFELFDGYAKMYVPGKNEPIDIRSKFLSKLFSELRKNINKKEVEDRLKKSQEEANNKEIEFKEALKQYGGIVGIAETILDRIKDPKSYWRGQIRLDKSNELVMLSPTNDSKEGRSIINTLIVNLDSGQTRLEKSYGAYADHKRFDGKLTSSEIKSLDKYVKIAKDTAKMKDDEKAEAIRKLMQN